MPLLLLIRRRNNSRGKKQFLRTMVSAGGVLLVLTNFFLTFYMLDKELIALSTPYSSQPQEEVYIPIVRGECPCFSKSEINDAVSLIEAGRYDLKRSSSCRSAGRNITFDEISIDVERNSIVVITPDEGQVQRTKWAYSRGQENTCESHGHYKDFKAGSVLDFIDCERIINDACMRISPALVL